MYNRSNNRNYQANSGKPITKNIFQAFIQNNVKHVNLSSKLCNTSDNSLLAKNILDTARNTLDCYLFGIRKNQYMEKLTISYKKPNLETDLKREIYILDNFQQSIFMFEERFIQTSDRAGWNNKKLLQCYLKS